MLSILRPRPLAVLLVGAFAVVGLWLPLATAAGDVNVYSYRQPFLIKPLFDVFTRETGIAVNLVYAPQGLVERLKSEGRNSPADLIFTVDIGRLTDAVEAGVTQPVASDFLAARIPAHLRHPDGHWFGLTKRARLIYAAKRAADANAITTYEELADPKWRGRICTRSGSHAYQVALTAAMIAHHGEAKAQRWLTGVKSNLARKPQGNDRAQVKAIKEGVCDISLGNNYYLGLMVNDEEQSEWAAAVNPLFATIGGKGTHMNVSGMALTSAAPNRANAVALMEFLAGELAQQMYAEQNFEYPVNNDVPWSGFLRSLGEFAEDDIDLAAIAAHRAAAMRLVNTVGYNE